MDVALGAKLFRHLLALPIVCSGEARRVGDSVARVRELENIRNFLTGSALTLVVDLVFTFVFCSDVLLQPPIDVGRARRDPLLSAPLGLDNPDYAQAPE